MKMEGSICNTQAIPPCMRAHSTLCVGGCLDGRVHGSSRGTAPTQPAQNSLWETSPCCTSRGTETPLQPFMRSKQACHMYFVYQKMGKRTGRCILKLCNSYSTARPSNLVSNSMQAYDLVKLSLGFYSVSWLGFPT